MNVREKLVVTTAELMRRRGVAGTAISDILAGSGVARRSIYLNFPGGKSELVETATVAAGGLLTTMVADCMATEDPVAAFIDLWSKALIDSDFEAGCPVVSAALGADSAPGAAAAAATAFRDWTALISARLVDEGVPAAQAEMLATTIIAAVEGALVLSQSYRSVEPLRHAGEHIRILIEASVQT